MLLPSCSPASAPQLLRSVVGCHTVMRRMSFDSSTVKPSPAAQATKCSQLVLIPRPYAATRTRFAYHRCSKVPALQQTRCFSALKDGTNHSHVDREDESDTNPDSQNSIEQGDPKEMIATIIQATSTSTTTTATSLEDPDFVLADSNSAAVGVVLGGTRNINGCGFLTRPLNRITGRTML